MANYNHNMAQTKKTCLITGCSSGIGKSMALEFHRKGLRVFATARNADTLEDLRAEGIETLSLEVHKPESIEALKAEITKRTEGKLHVLVNNAGRNYTVPALEVDYDEVQMTFEVNVFSVMRMCQAFAPLLIKGRGTIVQIGSVAGIMPYVFGSVYNASKAALHQYSSTLRLELAPFSVKVIVVVTGGVESMIARTDRKLQPDSLYLPIEEDYQRRVKHSQEGAMPSDDYAKSVVGKVMKLEPPVYIWEGNRAWMIWAVDTFLWRTFMDRILIKMFNLFKLAHIPHRLQEKKTQ